MSDGAAWLVMYLTQSLLVDPALVAEITLNSYAV